MAAPPLESCRSPEPDILGIERAWRTFIDTGEIDSSVIRPVIAESWKRSKEMGVDPYDKERIAYRLDDGELRARIEANNDLIETAWPFMEMLWSIVRGSGFRVDIVDRDGYLLRTLGENEVSRNTIIIPLMPGSNRLESFVGTTGIGIALTTGQPVQVVGAEHYNVHLHRWTCSSAPIRDPNGEVIGVLNMGGYCGLVHRHTLGMIVGAAKAVERQLALRNSARELAAANGFLRTVISSINDGLISIDKNGVVTHFNRVAAEILQCDPREIIGRRVGQAFSMYPQIQEMLSTLIDREVPEREVVVRGRGGSTRCLISIKPIREKVGDVLGTTVIMSKMEKVRKLAHRMLGAQARFTFGDIIGEDEKFKEALRLARIAAATSSKVLLQGESGTGKELFAQAIHNESPWRDGPFVAVNCGAVPRDLMESELFGYEEGAFTGARKGGRPGRFELAEGGTLFLDELDSMSLEMQAKLLRVLEDGQVVRVGGSEVIAVNVRVIAATNKDLGLEVQKGNFREDLFYRLNVITISIPPLRERPGDIPLLVEHFLRRSATNAGGTAKNIDPEALEALCVYSYPGNVRELENILERAILLAQGDRITLESLPAKVRECHTMSKALCEGAKGLGSDASRRASFRGTNEAVSSGWEEGSLYRYVQTRVVSEGGSGAQLASLSAWERKAILEVLRATGGNVSRAAKILGVGRPTLYRKLRKYEISRSQFSW